jgi:hypothetical protein
LFKRGSLSEFYRERERALSSSVIERERFKVLALSLSLERERALSSSAIESEGEHNEHLLVKI